MGNYNDWDFKKKHVQDIALEHGQDFVSSESIVVCASTKLDTGIRPGLANLIPIGVLENASVIQNKQIQQIFEIGSRLPYFIPGRTYIQINLTRILFNGDNLLAVLYPEPEGVTPWPRDEGDKPGATITTDTYRTKFYIDLASEFFNRPSNLAFVIHDSEDQPVGAMLLLDAFIQNYQMSITGQQTIVLENATLRCANIEGLDITT